MKNNITLIGINFYPEDTAIGLYSTQLATYLSISNNVTVITGFPYYPEWRISKDYENKRKYYSEQIENIKILRYKQYVPSNPMFMKRIYHLIDFTFGSIRNIFKIKKTDLVICIIPFTSSIILGLLLSKLRRAKVWVHIQDFEFDAAVESGLSGKNNWLKTKIFKLLFLLEGKLLDRANIVSTISFSMLSKLDSKTKAKKIFFPNWVDEHFIDPSTANKHRLMTSVKYKILYSGNIGTKQDWDLFIRLVRHFKFNIHVEFIVVGAGAKKDWLVEQTQELENIKYYLPVEYSELSDLLCSADLHILFQKNDVLDTVMPSKILGMMASSKPSLVTGNIQSEVAKIFEKSKGGYFFDSDRFDEIVEAINSLSVDKQLAKSMGMRAREYVVEHFAADKVLSEFGKKVNELINPS